MDKDMDLAIATDKDNILGHAGWRQEEQERSIHDRSIDRALFFYYFYIKNGKFKTFTKMEKII